MYTYIPSRLIRLSYHALTILKTANFFTSIRTLLWATVKISFAKIYPSARSSMYAERTTAYERTERRNNREKRKHGLIIMSVYATLLRRTLYYRRLRKLTLRVLLLSLVYLYLQDSSVTSQRSSILRPIIRIIRAYRSALITKAPTNLTKWYIRSLNNF